MATTNGTFRSKPDVQVFDDFLAANPAVKLVHLHTVDLSGSFRTRLVPVQSLRHCLVENDGFHAGSGTVADLVMPSDNAILPELLAPVLKTAKIRPDLSTLRKCHDSAGIGNTAAVMATVDIMDLDPRLLLQKKVAEAESQHGLSFKVGFELEFALLDADGSSVPAGPQQVGLHNSAIMTRSRYWPIFNEVMASLAEEGIYAIECHKEYAVTQFEIALPPYDPVQAVDICMYTRELIRDISYKHGLIATFYPDPYVEEEQLGNGAHVHISATPVASSSSFKPDHFLGGLLGHLPALSAIGMPSIDSYPRAREASFGGGAYVAWGTNNRFVALRKVSSNHWEVRSNDGCANLYLMVLGIIAAGLDAKPLTHKEVDQAIMLVPEEEKKKLQRMPSTLAEALEALEQDGKWAEKTFGKDLLYFYKAAKNHEMEVLGKMDAKERKRHQIQFF